MLGRCRLRLTRAFLLRMHSSLLRRFNGGARALSSLGLRLLHNLLSASGGDFTCRYLPLLRGLSLLRALPLSLVFHSGSAHVSLWDCVEHVRIVNGNPWCTLMRDLHLRRVSILMMVVSTTSRILVSAGILVNDFPSVHLLVFLCISSSPVILHA